MEMPKNTGKFNLAKQIDGKFYLSNKAKKMFYSLLYWRLCQVPPTSAPMSLVVLSAIAIYLKTINLAEDKKEKALFTELNFEQYYTNVKQRVVKKNGNFAKRFIKLADRLYKDDVKFERKKEDMEIALELGLCFYDYFLHEVNDIEFNTDLLFQ